MPELPEVVTSAKYISKDISGKTIENIDVLVPKMIKEITSQNFIKKLKGKKIIAVENEAKFLVFKFDTDLVMLSHLRMEGKYRFEKEKNIGKHDHIIFELNDGFLIYNDTRKFGTFQLRTEDNYKELDPIKKMGPYPNIDALYLVFNKLKNKRIAIKTALLDQTIVSGIGNIYVDEILWKSKVYPLTPSNKVAEWTLKTILVEADKILKLAIKKNGSSIKSYLAYNNIKGEYQNYLEVHTKEGSLCSRCKTKIQKIKVNGRGTYYCPKCQDNNL